MRSDILRMMRIGLIMAFIERDKVRQFYKDWQVMITMTKILEFVKRWIFLERQRDYNIRKVKESPKEASLTSQILFLVIFRQNFVNFFKMLTVTYMLTLEYKKKIKVKGESVNLRLAMQTRK